MSKQKGVIYPVSIILLLVTLVVVGCGEAAPSRAAQPKEIELNVSAAASLTDVLTEINGLYMQRNKNVTIVSNFAASGTLQKQIEQGAPVDIFISAAAKQMQALQDGGLILNESRQNLLTNKIVLVVPPDSKLQITSFLDLLKDDVKQIAIGDPEFVPSGIYGKQALQSFGIYDNVERKLIMQIDTPHVLGYLESGNVDAGIVYATDVALTNKVIVVANAPDQVNKMIVYPIAITKASKNAEAAQAYIDYLNSAESISVFEKYGFSMVKK